MFKDTLGRYCPDLTEEQLTLLNEYYILLSAHGSQYNLTAITEETEVVIKHFYDSLLFGEHLGIGEGKQARILDLGTGAGFPGRVLAIIHQDLHFTLVDAVNKKINFIRIVAEELGLKNVDALHARSEALGQDQAYREQFDIGLARGVAYLPTLSEYLLPLIRLGGRMILTKEAPYEEELVNSCKALETLGGAFLEARNYELPVFGNKRAFLIFGKVAPTPVKYPRREGVPSKKPL